MNTAPSIRHERIPATLAICRRFNLKARSEIQDTLHELARSIPSDLITGNPYCLIQFFSRYPEGFEVEIGFPVRDRVDGLPIECRETPPMEVLSLLHSGARADLRTTKIALSRHASDRALISDEFTREEYPDWQNPEGPVICQFVIHNWGERFERNLRRVLGESRASGLLRDLPPPGIDASASERFDWAAGMMRCLDAATTDDERYDIVSSCAHVWPPRQVEVLRTVYREACSRSGTDPVDAVITFMAGDPGWSEKDIRREGNVIIHTKHPCDPVAHAAAQTPEAKRAAYCFCPVIRDRLRQGISDTYCYCGSGWFRQEWETATGKPVRVRVLQSVLRGDDVCQFAVELSDSLASTI